MLDWLPLEISSIPLQGEPNHMQLKVFFCGNLRDTTEAEEVDTLIDVIVTVVKLQESFSQQKYR